MDEQDEIQTKPTVTYTRKPKKQPKQKSAIEILDIQYTQDELNEFQAKLDSGEFNIAPNIPPCTEQHDNQPFDRICASIVGLAWGDVLGSPVEGYRWYHIRPIYAKSDEIVEPVPDALFGLVYDPSYADRLIKPYYHQMPDDIPLSQIKRYGGMKFIRKCRPLGFWSDDTQQALALLNCLLLDPTAGEIFVEEWRQWIIRGWQTKAWRGVGGNFTNASKLLAEPANSVYQCGSDSMGIGAAMKIGPIGAMLRWASISELSNAIAHATFVTHASIPGASLSFAVAYIVQQFVNGQEVNSIRANLIDLMRSFETEYQQQHLQWKLNRDKDVHLMSDTMKKIFAFMEESSESDPGMFLRELRDFISETAKQYFTGQDEEKMDAKSKKIKAYHVNQGPVILGGAHALAVSLISKLIIDPDDILISICQLGYDTDTVAAIAGTMLGARYGMSFLKPHLTQIVNSQLLVDYALRISEFDPANENTHTPLETIEQYMKRESLVTATEKALQKDLKSRQIN